MTKIEWSQDYCTGIVGVDYEHEQLIRRINELLASIHDQADTSMVIDGLGEIYGSLSAHFSLEEQMMLRHTYERYREHKADHDRLLDEIRELTGEYRQSVMLDEAALEQKLANWLQMHIKTHDSRLHSMASMRQHEPASQSTVESLVNFAKEQLLQGQRESH